jgi:LysM repeat protein
MEDQRMPTPGRRESDGYPAAPSGHEAGSPRVCPYLGIAGDPSSRFEFPEGGHRCHARRDPGPIELAYQAGVCLGGAYGNCKAYQRAAWNQVPGTRPSRRWAAALTRSVAVILLTVGVLLAVAVGRAIIEGPPGTGAEPSDPPAAVLPSDRPPTPMPTTEPMPTPFPSPGPTEPPAATPTAAPPTASPRPTIGASPTPVPQPTPLIHIVQPGESVWSIAQLYGVRRRDIAEANGLVDRNYIQVGQPLVIPEGTP